MSRPEDAGAGRAWVGDVLGFWFGELPPEAWFKADAQVDGAIRHRFGALFESLREAAIVPAIDARTALATCIVLDQFPRNLFRGDARAFATDAAARAVTQAALRAGFDLQLEPMQRLFLYLPLEHSETVGDQVRSVELIGALGDEKLTGFAVAHKAIIDRFGRFPHRNAVLGRVSTPEELAFLQQPGSTF